MNFNLEPRKCTYKAAQKDRYLIYVDKTETAQHDGICQRACDSQREFNCRSYSFLAQVNFYRKFIKQLLKIIYIGRWSCQHPKCLSSQWRHC
jgi:hypothetical protein